MFVLTAPAGSTRGRHAHKRCSQFIVCVNGRVDVTCEDGRNKTEFALDRREMALLVPPGIWNTVLYRQSNSVLTALCDRPYEAEDYIRDYFVGDSHLFQQLTGWRPQVDLESGIRDYLVRALSRTVEANVND